MFNHLRLTTLLALGFGVIVAVLITTSTLSYLALNSTGQGFKEYRLLARDTNLAGRLQANMLFARLYVKDFFKTGSQSSVGNYNSRLTKLNAFLDEAKVQITQKDRAKQITLISDSIDSYIQNFSIIVAYKKERDILVFDNLDPAGLKMRTKLTAIMTSAFSDKDPEASYYAGRIQEHVLLARLYANKYLNTNVKSAAERFEKEIGINIDLLVSTLDQQLENPTRREFFGEFLDARKSYRKHFVAVKNLISKRNAIIEKQLDTIGPIISSAAEDVKLSVKHDQDTLGPELQSSNDALLIFIEVFSILGIIFSLLLAWFISKKIKQPIGGEPLDIMAITQQVALGKTTIEFNEKETATGIYLSLKEMVNSLNKRVLLAQEIAKGNWNSKVELLSPEDSLGLALQKMLSQLKERNDKLLQESLEKSQVMAEIEAKNWVKTQVEDINNMVQDVDDLQLLAKTVIQRLAKTVSAGHGVFYALKASEQDQLTTLSLLGSYAFNQRKNISNDISLGEGLIGQCALEKQTILLTQVPADYVQISSGLGQHEPSSVIAIPIIYDNTCLGVIELASFNNFTQQYQDLLQQVCINLGFVINNLLSRKRIQNLLDDSKHKATQLQEQQEELKSANENLIEQTEQLTASEEELRQQSEELTVSNEELAEQQKSLQAQKDKITISEQELQVKAKELMIASKYKSEFLANMSHELRTPLNSLLLLAKGLADNHNGHLDETEVEDAQIIYGGGQSLLSLINDILDLSKVEAGKLNIHIEPIVLSSIKAELLQLFTPLAKDQNLTLSINIDDSAPDEINTDSQRLAQILRNLLSNAIKFTEMGEVDVELKRPNKETHFRSPHLTCQNCIAIEVKDTGIGISEAKLQDIFEVFQQEDGSTSRKYGGTGLGLTIARELTRLLGGEIQLQSILGKGSCFTVFLPLDLTQSEILVTEEPLAHVTTNLPKNVKTAIDQNTDNFNATNEISTINNEDDNVTQAPEESSLAATSFIDDDRKSINDQDKTLLIIDDDKIFAKILRDYAHKDGYKCLVAGDGKSGIYLANRYQPTGIILDLMLPDIDGHQVLEKLKANQRTQHIPVEIISAHSEDRREAITGGAIGLQTKPVSSEQLQRVLIELENISKAKIRQILVVEDNEHHRKATKRLLENIGLKAHCVATGEEGCKEILSGKYECVILDLGLPDISGIEILKRIHESDLEIFPPIIIYTGKELTDSEQAQLDKYRSTIVIKGVGSPERLLDDISLFLRNIEKSNISTELSDNNTSIIKLLDEDSTLLGKKILLTDDDMRNSYALSKKLIEMGCDVEMANNGQEAIEVLSVDPKFELVLMDTMMPIMDGNEATAEIRKMDNYKDIPIIALTAKTMPEDRELALNAGASEYLTKPVDFEKLVSILKVWLFNQTNERN